MVLAHVERVGAMQHGGKGAQRRGEGTEQGEKAVIRGGLALVWFGVEDLYIEIEIEREEREEKREGERGR